LHVSGGTFVRVPEAKPKKVNIVGFFGLASWDAQQKVQNRKVNDKGVKTPEPKD
jgi:hypothetical protein